MQLGYPFIANTLLMWSNSFTFSFTFSLSLPANIYMQVTSVYKLVYRGPLLIHLGTEGAVTVKD